MKLNHTEQFLLIDGVIYQNDAKTNDFRLDMPMNLREEAIALCHSFPSSGHQGAERTKERVKEKFVWYGLG